MEALPLFLFYPMLNITVDPTKMVLLNPVQLSTLEKKLDVCKQNEHGLTPPIAWKKTALKNALKIKTYEITSKSRMA